MDTPDVCKRCAASPPTCCVLAEVEKELCFPIFPTEQERLKEKVPARTGEGCEPPFVATPNTPELISAMVRLFPGEEDSIHALFPEDGQHVRLGTDAGGYCVFLGDDGCILSTTDRPAHCRLFPLWMDGNHPRYLDAECLAIAEARGIAMLFRLLNTDPGTIATVYADLRSHWGLPPVELEEEPAATEED